MSSPLPSLPDKPVIQYAGFYEVPHMIYRYAKHDWRKQISDGAKRDATERARKDGHVGWVERVHITEITRQELIHRPKNFREHFHKAIANNRRLFYIVAYFIVDEWLEME